MVPDPPPPPLTSFKRLNTLPDEALSKQLLHVPEVALDDVPNTSTLLFAAAQASQGTLYPGPAVLLAGRAALSGLPFLPHTKELRLPKERAKDLGTFSTDLHGHLQACSTGEGDERRPDLDRLRQLLAQRPDSKGQWRGPDALPALLQILQVQEAPVRLVLVELLAEIDDPRAQAALAVRAIIDVSAEVRQAAVRALARRPTRTYRDLLLSGFRYPWPPAASHAAEALVALGDKDAIPMLTALYYQPPPSLPFAVGVGAARAQAVRELVRVNHLRNCLLCHPPSFHNADPVRGVIPVPSQAPGSQSGGGYMGVSTDRFVRADITYLRQDFSVLQPVAHHPASWPNIQRFDYIVRVRPVRQTDLIRSQQLQQQWTLEYRAAVHFALRELNAVKADTLADGAAGLELAWPGG
jgi:hypothetical protein